MSTRPRPGEALVGGLADAFATERASASPAPRRPARRRRITAPAPALVTAAPLSASLADLQRFFAGIVMHPDSVNAGTAAARCGAVRGFAEAARLERVLTSGPQQDALERIGVYHYAYHARLVECLADDFPTVRHALGETVFSRLARAFIAAHPSRSANLNSYGGGLVTYCRAPRRSIPRRAFVADLATLEWAMVEVLHAAAAPTLSTDALRTLSPERWARLRFRPSATVRLLRFDHPVNAYLQAFREERAPRIPRPGWSATAVYRQGFTIWRMDLSPPMAEVLAALFAGKTLGDALAALQRRHADAEALVPMIMRCFREWTEGGLFAALEE